MSCSGKERDVLEIVQARGASKFEYFQCSHSAGATSKVVRFSGPLFRCFSVEEEEERFFRHLCGELPRRAGYPW